MSDEPQDDVLELGEEHLAELPEPQGDDTQPAAQAEDDIELPAFGDAAEDEDGDSDLAKKLRAEIRDRDKRLKAFEEGQKPAPEIVVGERPTMESCEWDDVKFEAELDAYKERKRQAEEQAGKHSEAQRKANEAWQGTLTAYATKRAAYPQPAMEEAENAVAATLSPQQQAIIVQAADNPAKLIIALGRNQTKLDAIANTTDPIRFAALVAKLEGEVKMVRRKPSVEPDVPQRGSGPASASTVTAAAKTLERLEKEAERTGNRDKIIAFKRTQKEKAA